MRKSKESYYYKDPISFWLRMLLILLLSIFILIYTLGAVAITSLLLIFLGLDAIRSIYVGENILWYWIDVCLSITSFPSILLHLFHGEEELEALFFSIKKDRWLILRFLIALDVNLEIKDANGRTGLMIAVWDDHVVCVKRLIAAGADINAKDNWGNTLLMFAVGQASREVVEILIKAGADINAKDDWGNTPLTYAIKINRIGVIPQLIEAGADINAKDDSGNTPLMLAVDRANRKVVEILIKAGANIEAKNNGEYTALMLAISKNNQYLIKILIKEGANIEVKDSSGDTTLIYVTRMKYIGYIDQLIAVGADIDARDSLGNTALMLAVSQGNIELVNRFIAAGANKNHGDILGKTALMLAVEKGYQKCVDALAPSGVNFDKLQPNDTEWLEYILKSESKDIAVNFILNKKMYPSLNIALNLMHRAVFCRNYNAVRLLAGQGSLNEQLSYTQEKFEALVLYLKGEYINFVTTIYENSIYVERRIQIKLKKHLDTMILNRANNIKEYILNVIRLNNSRNPIDYLKKVIVQKKLAFTPIFNKWEEILTTDISTMEGVVLVEYLYRALPIDESTIERQKPLVQGDFYKEELSIELYRLHAFFLTIEGRHLVDDEYRLLLNSSTLFSVDTSFQKLYNCRIKLAYQYAREQYIGWFREAYKIITIFKGRHNKENPTTPPIPTEMIDAIFSFLQPYYAKGWIVVENYSDTTSIGSLQYGSKVLKPGEKCMVMITVDEDENHFSSLNTGRLNPLFTKAG